MGWVWRVVKVSWWLVENFIYWHKTRSVSPWIACLSNQLDQSKWPKFNLQIKRIGWLRHGNIFTQESSASLWFKDKFCTIVKLFRSLSLVIPEFIKEIFLNLSNTPSLNWTKRTLIFFLSHTKMTTPNQ